MTSKTAFANDTGLLWFDDNPGRDLTDKISQAAQRYRQKYGAEPDVCYVHPSALSDNDNGKVKKVGDVRIAPWPTVLVHYLWIGVEEKRDSVKAVQGRLL